MVQTFAEDAPLGAEDAARREDVGTVFVDVRELIPQTHLHTNDIRSIKVVVGRKGSGKTHVLRYIEESSSATREIMFCALSDNTIPSRLEAQFASLTDRPHARSYWSKFWRIVISLSIITRFTIHKASLPARKAASRFLVDLGHEHDQVRPDEWKSTRQKLIDHFQRSYFHGTTTFSLGNIRDRRDPASITHLLLEGISNIRTMQELIDHVDITALEGDVASLAKNYRPVHMIIDGVDDVSWRQPRTWLDFQVGLFDAVFFFNEAQRSSEQVSLTVAIRNFVYLAAAESPHIDRIRGLLSLNWTPESALSFLNRRLHQVSNGSFADSQKLDSERPLAEWLGFDSVMAVRRERDEPVEQYFLRHTRLSPRNLIRLFNLLAQRKNHRLSEGKTFKVSDFRDIVAKIGNEVSTLMLQTTAEEIIAFVPGTSLLPKGAGASEGVVLWVATVLEEAIRQAGSEVLEFEGYQRFLQSFLHAITPSSAREEADSESKAEANLRIIELVLWRSNVIAFWDDRRFDPGWVFSWSPREDAKPRTGGRVGFHSSLIGKCDLEVSDHGPVF